MAGAALNYAHIFGDFRRSRGDFDTDSYGVLFYAGLLPAKNLFIDVVAGYTRHDYDIERDVAFGGATGNGFVRRSGTAVGDTSGDQFTASVRGGYDFILRNLTIGPRVGLNYRFLTIDGFAEKGRRGLACLDATCLSVNTTGLELAYERQEETSLTSTMGVFASLAIGTGIGVIVPQTTLEWFHEFEDNQRTIHFRFVDDFSRTKLKFNNDPPDRDYFNVGAGVAVVLRNGLSPFLNYRALVGYKDRQNHAVTVGLRIPF